ncbi:MAG TPA: hypothetical protein VMS00_09495 [Acidimicrobiales bacterium]|nr:hypothetical protein [Acidimicrobiales bacterium]
MDGYPGRYMSEGFAHNRDLPVDTIGKVGPVPATNPETEVDSEQAANVYFVDGALELLSVDHPHARRSDRQVVDVRSRAGHATVVENKPAGFGRRLLKQSADSDLAM